jgi:hypothetical protein
MRLAVAGGNASEGLGAAGIGEVEEVGIGEAEADSGAGREADVISVVSGSSKLPLRWQPTIDEKRGSFSFSFS